jgi:hypothetical protein
MPPGSHQHFLHAAVDLQDEVVGGRILAGTWIFGLPGVIAFTAAHLMMRKARVRGVALRDDMVTLIGVAMLVDGCAN